ncbi:MAG: hypothetical protein QMD43_01595 [Thermodesulfovibrio sp.]|uniref:hypothetical protein n=1 Tax=unclassified Thermodesulfovibrio TaxID=2645936 RepID=UPI00083B85EC|nr:MULTISPECIES: hypothetical protein [unclassified Thermodesulfovibrio]MDI1471818.1 hypothetical protein [Thermodesulfovibrio sp. 1176]MDI6713708.1 hypothetical protein [Thermodesulfovibrio sp.]ODA43365.1 hypothetical protein THER_1911 [Thermodesulfovibrio sp. N1]
MIQPIIDSSGVIHIFKGKQAEPIKLVIGEILTAEIMDIFPTGTIQIRINNRILNAQPQRELPLNKGETIYVKVEKPLQDGTIPLRVLSSSETVEYQKKSLLQQQIIYDEILKLIETVMGSKENLLVNQRTDISGFLNNEKIEQIIRHLLNLPTENLLDTIKDSLMEKISKLILTNTKTTTLINDLIKILEEKGIFKEQINQLKSLIIDNTDLTQEKLKQALLNSGVNFEAKLKHALSDLSRFENLREDLKSIIKNIIDQAKAEGIKDINDKAQHILRHIETYQVLSKTYQSFFTFLPIVWNEIEGGNISFKSFKRQGKDYHTVFISLKIKENSFLSFIVTMISKNFYISFSGSSEMLDLIKNYENELKNSFRKRGMNIGGINYVTKIEELIKQWNIKEGLISVTV